jgi:hypothetical protein
MLKNNSAAKIHRAEALVAPTQPSPLEAKAGWQASNQQSKGRKSLAAIKSTMDGG